MQKQSHMRTTATAGLLLLLSGCTKTGINAGEQGGQAFVLFTVMLLITIAILWFILGREE